MKAELDRRLVAVMFTDMVGYTALIQADELAAIRKRAVFWAAVEAQHAAFGGTIVQRLGDGSLSMFPSALAAVQAAIETQRELAAQDVPVAYRRHAPAPSHTSCVQGSASLQSASARQHPGLNTAAAGPTASP